MTIHKELATQNGQMIALSEFAGGHNDACGPYALEQAKAALAVSTLSVIEAENIRSREIAEGWLNGVNGPGIITDRLHDDIVKNEPDLIVAYYMPYAPGVSFDLAKFHTAISTYAGVLPIIWQMEDARQMPENEQASHAINHFSTIVGIDSVLGYAVLDPDDIEALAGHTTYPARWYGWDIIAATRPIGLIVLDRKTPEMSLPTGWTDDGTSLHNPQTPFVVQHGFRDHILGDPTWSALHVPTDNEHYTDAAKTQVRQTFAYTLVFGGGVPGIGVGFPLPPFTPQPLPPDPVIAEKAAAYDEFVRLASGDFSGK